MELVETPIFTRQVTSELSEDEYRYCSCAFFNSPMLGRPSLVRVVCESYGGGCQAVASAAARA